MPNTAEKTMSSVSHTTDITSFGRAIFAEIGRQQPSAFNKNFWSGRIMEWSMTKPEFKLNMFRLVDVLPTLRTSAAIAAHVNEYLGTLGASISGLADWGLNVPPNSLRAKVTALVVKKSVGQMASQFIAGEDPESALKPLRKIRKGGMCATVDLLGEFCVSEDEATAYLERYLTALDVFGREMPNWNESAPIIQGHPGERSPICVSVKMTALYSQCSALNFDRSVAVLSERLGQIARKAKALGAIMYVDAEDSASNPIIYEAFKRVFISPEFIDMLHPGIVVQAYNRSAGGVIEDLLSYAKKRGTPIAIRLVKGAYWDYETILAKQGNLTSPLWENKESSDAAYELLSRRLLDNHRLVLPAFGSHNVRSLSHACCYALKKGLTPKDFELQMLFGMADPIAQAFAGQGYLVRFYVPLGELLPGMGYLVRRLLENTSNESFLRHTFFQADSVDQLLAEPVLRESWISPPAMNS